LAEAEAKRRWKQHKHWSEQEGVAGDKQLAILTNFK
jgi:hypothetical protein